MSRPTLQEWERLFETNPPQFFAEFTRLIDQEEMEPIRELSDLITAHVFYLHENRRLADLEELLPLLRAALRRLTYLRDRKPGLSVVKGRLETLAKLIQYYASTIPDVQVQLLVYKSKYDTQILAYLLRKNLATMGEIAQYLHIQHPQLTPIVQSLEERELVYREKNGKNMFCSLTKKGFTLAKHLSQMEQVKPITEVIQALIAARKRQEDANDIKTKIDAYRQQYPQLLPVFESLKELWDLRTIHHEVKTRDWQYRPGISVFRADAVKDEHLTPRNAFQVQGTYKITEV